MVTDRKLYILRFHGVFMSYTDFVVAGRGAIYLAQTAPARAYKVAGLVLPVLLSGCVTVDNEGMQDFWSGALTGGSFEAGTRHVAGKGEASDDKKQGPAPLRRDVVWGDDDEKYKSFDRPDVEW